MVAAGASPAAARKGRVRTATLVGMRTGAILLVGGRSTRMGRAKAGLDWHGEPLAARVARVLRRAVCGGPLVAVCAPDQELPTLPEGIDIAADPTPGEGPLRGISVGLTRLADRADIAFVSSVDAPLLHARFIHAVMTSLGDANDAAVPVAHEHRHPLAAAYRVSLAPLLDELLADGERRPGVLLARVRTRFLDEDDLRAASGLGLVDPTLSALRNVNTPEEYDEVRALPAPMVEIDVFGTLRQRSSAIHLTAPAFRLEQAVEAAGLALDGHVVAAINGEQIVSDGAYPLGPGDRVSLISADGGG
jgi:molybdenum cofactor guanylyltransferase